MIGARTNFVRVGIVCGLAAALSLGLSASWPLMGYNIVQSLPAPLRNILTILPDWTQWLSNMGFVWLSLFIHFSIGGAIWGLALALVIGRAYTTRFVLVSASSFGAMTTLAFLELQALRELTDQVNVTYSVIFPVAVLIVAAVNGFSLGLALKNGRLATQLAITAGLIASLTFLAVATSLDALGLMRVGGGGIIIAAMPKVTTISNIVAAGAGGATIGLIISRQKATA